jgi:hypothetical protein
MFYKHFALLSKITPSRKGLFKLPLDDDGWVKVQEGIQMSLFAMPLPPDGG